MAITPTTAAVNSIEAVTQGLAQYVDQWREDPDVLALLLPALELAQKDLSILLKDVSRHLLALVGNDPELATPAGRTIIKFWDKPTEKAKADKTDEWLIDQAYQHSFDPRTGEKHDPIATTVRIVRGYCTAFGPRKQTLKATGQNPDDFFDVKWGDPKVRVIDAEVSQAPGTMGVEGGEAR